MKEHVLITGALGYVGSHTAVALSAAGYSVVLLDNLSKSSINVLKNLREISGLELAFVSADVRDFKAVVEVLKTWNIGTVIHLAGYKAVSESVCMPIEYYDNNVNGSLQLIKAMIDVGVNKLVFSSSATVYGAPITLPIDENHPTNPTNPYGWSKLHAEQIMRDACDKRVSNWRGPLKVISLRYFNPVGAHPSGLLGDKPIEKPQNLMPIIAEVAMNQRNHVNVFGMDYGTADGSGVRDYIHVMDLAEAHLAACNVIEGSSGFQYLNLGTGEGTSVLELISEFQRVSGQKISFKTANRRDGDVAVCYANPSKARAELGWSANRTLSEMCASTWMFYQRALR